MGKRGAMPTFVTMDDYIVQQTPAVQKKLQELRSLIREAAPDATELLNCKVPTFQLVAGGKEKQQLMMAGYAKFVGFYPFPSAIAHFSEELKPYKAGKGSLQFPLKQALPEKLIKKMVVFRMEELREEVSKGGRSGKKHAKG